MFTAYVGFDIVVSHQEGDMSRLKTPQRGCELSACVVIPPLQLMDKCQLGANATAEPSK
jgi:hypothetical protein